MSQNTPDTSSISEIQDLITQLIESGNNRDILNFLDTHHEADIAEAIDELAPEIRVAFFNKIKPEDAVDIVEEMEIQHQTELISTLKETLAFKLVEEMEPDDRVDLLEELQERDEEKAEKLIESLPKKDETETRKLLAYPEDSAGSIMTTSFLSIPENLTVKQAIDAIKKQDPDDIASFFIYIISTEGTLIGFTTFRDLVMSTSNTKIKTIREEASIMTHTDTDQEEVAQSFRKYDIVEMPVINNKSEIVGIISIDDVVDVVVEEATEDIYKLSGTSELDESHLLTSSVFKATLSRSPWLLLTIVGGILASFLITQYSEMFSSSLFPLALSLSFIPMLMGLGGNVGNQSATIIVRGLATGTIKTKSAWQYVIKEAIVGLMIGIVMGSGVFFFNYSISGLSLLFSGIVSVALISNIFVATLIGTSLPLFFEKAKIDPAVASAPFISTTLDIIGQLIYFTLTLKVLSYIS